MIFLKEEDLIFIMALVSTTGRDQQMAIHLLLLHLYLHLQPSNGPIRAKHITKSSSVIGQYDLVSGVVTRESRIRPYVRHVHPIEIL